MDQLHPDPQPYTARNLAPLQKNCKCLQWCSMDFFITFQYFSADFEKERNEILKSFNENWRSKNFLFRKILETYWNFPLFDWSYFYQYLYFFTWMKKNCYTNVRFLFISFYLIFSWISTWLLRKKWRKKRDFLPRESSFDENILG